MLAHTFRPLGSSGHPAVPDSFLVGTVDHLFALAILIALALTLDILTGIFSAPSITATIIASRAMAWRSALVLSTIAELIGPFLFGVAVANAVASEVVNARIITLPILYAALTGAIVWTIVCWYTRIPSSVSHAQIGGMIGAAVVALGAQSLQRDGLINILISLTITVPICFICS